MNEKRKFHFHVKVSVPVEIIVIAESDGAAMKRLHRGAWHGVVPEPPDWSTAEITHTGTYEVE